MRSPAITAAASVALAALFATPAAAAPAKRGRIPAVALVLKVAEMTRNTPCGGLCGLRWGKRVKVHLALVNKAKGRQRLGLRMSCSGLRATLVISPTRRTGARPRSISLSKRVVCTRNGPLVRRVKAGGKLRASQTIVVPRVPAGTYAVRVDATIWYGRRAARASLSSNVLRRRIHK